ncbi:Ssl1-like protein, partial [Gymnopus androsaceus JB14]
MVVVGIKAGIGERISNLSGNDVLKSISDRHKLEPTGEPSLQSSIEMVRNSMDPSHSSREILIIFGSLPVIQATSETLDECVKSKIRISIVALAAEIKIWRELCANKTGDEW